MMTSSKKIRELVQKLRSKTASGQAQAANEISAIAEESSPSSSAGVGRFAAAGPILALVTAGAIPTLIHLLESSSVAKVHQAVADALTRIGRLGDAFRIMIAEAGGVPALVKLVQSGPPSVQGAAMTTLAFVASYTGGHTQAILAAAAEAIPSAIQILRSDPEIVHREAAMYFLVIMVTLDGNSRTRVAQADGAIPLIVQLLSSKSAALQEQSANVIENLVLSTYCHTGNRDSFFAAGAIPALVQMLLHPRSAKAEILALKALLALSWWEDPQVPTDSQYRLSRIRFAEAGAIPPLVRLLARGHSDTKGAASLILISLTRNADCCRRAAAAGAVPLLEQMVENESEEMQAQAKWPLSNIAALSNAGVQSEVTGCAAALVATGTEAMTSETGSLSPEGQAASAAALITGGGLQIRGGTSATSHIPGTTASDAALPHPLPQQQQPPPAANRKKLLCCWSCGAEGTWLKKCSGCAVASYCGAACQKADWMAHKGKCAELKASAAELKP